MAELAVIIPVFNAFEPLRACLNALDQHSPLAPVLIIDDASDDPRILPLLRQWVDARPTRRLLRQSTNEGFVKSANLGARESSGDFVLLNSDTQVTEGWLEAMARCLGSDRRIATATPWSNNAEIVSLPEFCVANPVPESPELWAAAVRRAARGSYPELPTAIGFCMAVARSAVDAHGLFDESSFGRGYGEENDFCRRVAEAGWRNVLCEDAFVTHCGGESFAPLGLRPDDTTMQRLLAKHPGYGELVAEWIRRDPLAERRAEILTALQSGNMNFSARD
jgi:GT2 family glycosyltransferase